MAMCEGAEKEEGLVSAEDGSNLPREEGISQMITEFQQKLRYRLLFAGRKDMGKKTYQCRGNNFPLKTAPKRQPSTSW